MSRQQQIIAGLDTIVTTPSLFFALYLTLANTFLAITHGPLDPATRFEFAEAYVSVLSVFLFQMFAQVRPQALPFIEAFAKLTIPDDAPVVLPKTNPQFLVEDGSSSSEDL